MSNVLFLNVPSTGHINPTLGLVAELIERGENVTYFCSDDFKDKVEKTGAVFKNYGNNIVFFTAGKNAPKEMPKKIDLNTYLNNITELTNALDEAAEYVLEQINGIKFDYMIYSNILPLGYVLAQILKIPAISSFAIFGTPKDLAKGMPVLCEEIIKDHPFIDCYKQTEKRLKEKFNATIPDLNNIFFNKGDLNIVYTSKYYVQHTENYDDSFIFIGPPIYNRNEILDFPFEKLKDKKVIYISLGTIFNVMDFNLYDIFFKTFSEIDAVVVMTAYNIDISKFNIPKNFIVKNYVPQTEILKYTTVAVTHGGMNSTSDLLFNNVPFVVIPIGADQPYNAERVSELGAAIALNKDTLTPQILLDAVEKVQADPSYIDNIKKINDSFRQTGGYKKAVDEIFKLKNRNSIISNTVVMNS